MISQVRKVKILEQIRQDGFVSIQDIMNTFHISRSSAMRDLAELEEQNFIVRQRGGASLKEWSSFSERATKDKQMDHIENKRRICQRASRYIRNGSSVYIDSGTTVLYILDFIKEMDLNIITPNVLLLKEIPDDFKGHITLLEGEYVPKSDCVTGPLCDTAILKYHFDVALFTANGFDDESVYSLSIPFAQNKKLALKQCDHPYLLVDHTKKNVQGFIEWAKVEDFEEMIID